MAASLVMKFALLLSVASYQVLAAQQQQKHTINVQSLLSSAMCSSSPAAADTRSTASPPGTGSRALQIVRRACLQTGGNHETVSEHYTAILRRDHYRVRSIHRRLAGQQSNTTTIPARLGLPYQSLEYVVTVGIGTPPQNFTVLFDTGSDLTWVHCLPCADTCHAQADSLFNPGTSRTYSAIPCDAPECQIRGGQQTSCGGTSCAYHVKYGDGSETFGNLAKDSINLSPMAPPATGVVFGCSERSTGFDHTAVAGILGLGRGDSSILSQTRPRSSDGGVVFSYCLPRRGSSTGGYLAVGGAAPPQSPNMSYAPLRTDNPRLSSVYVVDVASITVDGAAVSIPAGAFSIGAIVDSGTVVTHMPAVAYRPLRDAFRRQMGSYKMLPEGSVELLDTCYDVTGHDVVTVPRVAFVFGGGAIMDVDSSGILYVVGGSGAVVACLAFVPVDGVGLAVIGNMQQRGHNIVFDVAGGRVGFGPNGCS